MITWSAKSFEELSNSELHDLLKLRSDVFVVEQQCIYPDLDGQDTGAEHIMGHDEAKSLVAYARILPAVDGEPPRIGRVLVCPDHRGKGLGHAIMRFVLDKLMADNGTCYSMLSAQCHLESFYAAHGFERSGPDHDLDGIPHVDMYSAARLSAAARSARGTPCFRSPIP